jgi:hypothetical protein
MKCLRYASHTHIHSISHFPLSLSLKVTGPVHKESAMSMDLIVQVLIEAGTAHHLNTSPT